MGQGGQCPPPPTQILDLHWARLSGKEGGLGLLNWGSEHQRWSWNQGHHGVLGSSGKLLPSRCWSWDHLVSTLVVVPRISNTILLGHHTCFQGSVNSNPN